MLGNKTLFLFTISFPLADGEPFIENEFTYLLETFDKIEIICSSKPTRSNTLPEKVNVHCIYDIIKGKSKFAYYFKEPGLILSTLFREFNNCNSGSFFLKNLRTYQSTLLHSMICADYITRLKNFDRKAVFYSFWMNDHALTLSVLKAQKKIDRFLFRVHGYDLVLERWPYHYIAFQKTCQHYADRILTVSNKSLAYFKEKHPEFKNPDYSYLGTADQGINYVSAKEKEITLISCSNIIPLKRLHLIIEALMNVDIKIKWIHFGDGEGKKELIEKTKTLPSNIKVELKGQVSQSELFRFYKEQRIDFFINVSESEGLPYTIIEAISFGIPVIATDAGGTSEIVNEKTGILLELDCKPSTISAILNNSLESSLRSAEFRKGVRNFWMENFSASKVYPNFIQKELLSNVVRN